MAKFNLELEIDWIDEESSLDETVKQEIMAAISNRVTNKIQASILDEAEQKITDLVESLVTTSITERIEEFLSKPRDITDKYGDVVRKNVTVEDIFKEKMEAAFSRKTLDEKGQETGYNPRYSIIEFTASKGMEKMVGSFVSQFSKQVEQDIKNAVETKIKTEVADKLTNLIVDSSSVLGLNNGAKQAKPA